MLPGQQAVSTRSLAASLAVSWLLTIAQALAGTALLL